MTWLHASVQLEAVEGDDYPTTEAVVSRHRPDNHLARWFDEVEPGYEGFMTVRHRAGVDALGIPICLSLNRRQDDAESWAGHRWLRSCLTKALRAARVAVQRPQVPPKDPALPPSRDGRAVARTLLAHANTLAPHPAPGGTHLTLDPAANPLMVQDFFTFILALISDMGINAQRAWSLPFGLRRRLDHPDPARVTANLETVHSVRRSSSPTHRVGIPGAGPGTAPGRSGANLPPPQLHIGPWTAEEAAIGYGASLPVGEPVQVLVPYLIDQAAVASALDAGNSLPDYQGDGTSERVLQGAR